MLAALARAGLSDFRLNGAKDSPGDGGEIFLELVLGKQLAAKDQPWTTAIPATQPAGHPCGIRALLAVARIFQSFPNDAKRRTSFRCRLRARAEIAGHLAQIGRKRLIPPLKAPLPLNGPPP